METGIPGENAYSSDKRENRFSGNHSFWFAENIELPQIKQFAKASF